jgi:uncharacterized phage protein (TIGR01671 family)
MKRERKLRAYNPETKEMIMPSSPYIGAGSGAQDVAMTLTGRAITPNSFGLDYGFSAPVPELIFMDFIGLQDGNKKDIFEGDILKVKDEYGGSYLNWLVVFKNGCFGVQNIHKDGTVAWNEFHPITEASYFITREVIGNMYQNPELINTP